jgi:hypothetical protein
MAILRGDCLFAFNPQNSRRNSKRTIPKSGVSAIPPLAQSLTLKDLQQFKRRPRRTPTFIIPQRIKRFRPRKQPVPGTVDWEGVVKDLTRNM